MTTIKFFTKIIRFIISTLICFTVALFFGEVNAYSDGVINTVSFLKYTANTIIGLIILIVAVNLINKAIEYIDKTIKLRREIRHKRNRIINRAKFADMY